MCAKFRLNCSRHYYCTCHSPLQVQEYLTLTVVSSTLFEIALGISDLQQKTRARIHTHTLSYSFIYKGIGPVFVPTEP